MHVKITTNDGGKTYNVREANFQRDSYYNINIYQEGYEFKVPNVYIPIPFEEIPVNVKIFLTGLFNTLYITFDYNVPNLLITDLTIDKSVNLTSIKSNDLGLTYSLVGDFQANTDYTFTIKKYGYKFNTVTLTTQKEFQSYTREDMLRHFGLSATTFKISVDTQGFRFIGSEYACVAVRYISSNALYGILFSKSVIGGVSAWHFLNIPESLNGSYYEPMSYLTWISMYNNYVFIFYKIAGANYYQFTGEIYAGNLNNYVDGKNFSWEMVINEYEMFDNENPYEELANEDWLWNTISPTALSTDNSYTLFWGFKYREDQAGNYYRDLGRIAPRANSTGTGYNYNLYFHNSGLSINSTRSYQATQFLYMNDYNFLTATTASGSDVSYIRLETGSWKWSMSTINLRWSAFQTDTYINKTIGNNAYGQSAASRKMLVFKTANSTVGTSKSIPVEFKSILPYFVLGNVKSLNLTSLDDTSYSKENVMLIALGYGSRTINVGNLNKNAIYWSKSTETNQYWYPREIVKNFDASFYPYDFIAQFGTLEDGTPGGVLIVSDSGTFHYLETSNDSADFYRSSLTQMVGE